MNWHSVNRGNFRIASVLYSLQDQGERASERARERLTQEERREERAGELWRRHIPSGRIEATFNDFGAGKLRQTATNFNLRVQSEVGPRPDQEDSGPQGRPEAGFEEDWASEGTEVHLSSVRGAGRPAALRLAGIAGGRWQPRSVRLAIRSARERRGERRWPRRSPATAATLRPRIAPRATRGRPGRYNNLAALEEIVFGVFVFRRADISDFFEIFPSAKCRISKCLTLESE